MTKQVKPENIVSEEDKKSISDGVTTISQVSKEKNIPYQSVYNQVKKGKLAVTFEKGSGVITNPNTPLPDFKESESPKIIDYTSSVSNFWSFIDMVFRFICPLFRLDYTGMDSETINDLTEKTKEKLGSFITGHTYVDWLGTIGVIGYTFITRIKVKPKEEKKNGFEEKNSGVNQESKPVVRENINKKFDHIAQEIPINSNEQPTNTDYKLTEDGLVKSDLSIDEVKKKLGIQ